ncbi:MAG: hypothetical protein ACXWTS_02905 [Methylococcaceae bacterium]
MAETQLIKFVFTGFVGSGQNATIATISEDNHFLAEINGMRCLIPSVLAASLRQYYNENLQLSNQAEVNPNG